MATRKVVRTSAAQRARFALVAALYREQVGHEIARRRRELDLSQADLAERIGVRPQTVSRWERGENLGHQRNLELVREALETTIPDLLSNIEGNGNRAETQLDRIEARLAAIERKLGI